MRRAIASFELCCSLAQLLKPTFYMCVYIYFLHILGLGIYTVADRETILAILAILATRVMRNVTKSITITSLKSATVSTRLLLFPHIYVHTIVSRSFIRRASRFAICGDTRISRRETRKKITEISLPSLFSFFFLFTFARALCSVSLPE